MNRTDPYVHWWSFQTVGQSVTSPHETVIHRRSADPSGDHWSCSWLTAEASSQISFLWISLEFYLSSNSSSYEFKKKSLPTAEKYWSGGDTELFNVNPAGWSGKQTLTVRKRLYRLQWSTTNSEVIQKPNRWQREAFPPPAVWERLLKISRNMQVIGAFLHLKSQRKEETFIHSVAETVNCSSKTKSNKRDEEWDGFTVGTDRCRLGFFWSFRRSSKQASALESWTSAEHAVILAGGWTAGSPYLCRWGRAWCFGGTPRRYKTPRPPSQTGSRRREPGWRYSLDSGRSAEE